MSTRATISKVQVFTIADELRDAGSMPTASSIRKQLGRGSYTTIQNFLDEWRQQSGPVLIEPKVPAELQRFLGSFISELWQLAQGQAKADLEEERQQLHNEQAILLKKVDEALTTTDVVKESATTYQQELKQVQQRYQQTQTELALSRQEATNFLRERQRADERIDALETENERLQGRLLKAEEELATVGASEKALKARAGEAQLQLEQQKATIARQNDQLDQLAEAHRTALSDLDDARAEAQRARDERSEIKQEAALTHQRFSDIQARYDKLHKTYGELITLSANHEAKASQLEQQLEQEKAAVDSLQADIEKLQQMHYQQTGQLATVKEELRFAQRALYRRDKDAQEE